MYCRLCRSQMPDGSRFCIICGAEQNVLQTETKPETKIMGQSNMVPKVKKKKSKAVIIIAASILVIAAAVLIPVMIESARAARYEQAFAFMDSGDMLKAKEEFVALGSYKDCTDMAENCLDTMDYEAANDLMETGDYSAAKQAFDKLGDFEQSKSLSTECQNTMDYNSAVALLDKDEPGQAKEIFLVLGGYKDSADLAAECQNRIDYTAADAAYNEGKYYTAYSLFSMLFDYSDAAGRAASCILPNPKTSEVYRNSDYSKKISVTIKTPKDGFSNFVKIYAKDGTLVSTVFIRSGEKKKIKLPKGTYRITYGYGTDWFGPEEAYGAGGTYTNVMFGADKDTWTLKSNYYYTLTLRVNKGGYEGMPENFEDF